jgi:hypothetical protein
MEIEHGGYTYFWDSYRNKYVEVRFILPKELPYAVKIHIRSEQESRKWFLELSAANF